jgi:PKD repeat protein
MICSGSGVQLKVQNGLASSSPTTYSWSFPGGFPSPGNPGGVSPYVNYLSPGYYDIQLTATNQYGSTTTTKTAVVYASGQWYEFLGPTIQDFNTSGDFWQSQNTYGDYGYFQRVPTGGRQNSGCFLLGNHYDPDTTLSCYMANDQQINGSKDNLISPAFDLTTSTGVTVSFDYAYGSAAPQDSATEMLKVYYSRDCGTSWILKQTIMADDLITASVLPGDQFIPSATQWKTASFPYVTNTSDTKTRFRFAFTASNYSNNFYIDNFVIDGLLGISDNELSGVTIFPNPAQKGGTIGISGLSASKADLTIRDIQGKLVYQKELSGSEAALSTDLKSGCYLVEITQNGSKFLTRLIIE